MHEFQKLFTHTYACILIITAMLHKVVVHLSHTHTHMYTHTHTHTFAGALSWVHTHIYAHNLYAHMHMIIIHKIICI